MVERGREGKKTGIGTRKGNRTVKRNENRSWR
jgi:hypothetical protein